jgi:flagellar secretion chaperone FliS
MNNRSQSALAEYQNTGNSSIAFADPHQLILRLMNGAIDRIAQAKGAMIQKDLNAKGELLGKAIGIISGLSACLDHNQEGDLSENLDSLYEYMNLTLLQANAEDDSTKLDEVSHLMQEIRSAWVQIPK